MSQFSPLIWWPEMDAELIAMRARGEGVVRCGERVGVSTHSICKRLDALGMDRGVRGWPRGRSRAVAR